MTLIVARIDKENIYIESDSKITDERLVRSDPLCGLLKTLILHPFVSVSFAGNVNYAELAIKNFFKYSIDDVNVLLQMLLDINVESCNTTDFIVATITDRIPLLFKISDGRVIDGDESAWIGDKKGFEVYQREFHSQENTASLKERMRTSFRAVMDSKYVESVGDFHVSTELNYTINPDHPVFLHALKMEVDISEAQTIRFEAQGQLQPIHLGTTAGGSCGISYLSTASPDYHGVAIHFTHGDFGVLFCPQLDFKGILIKGVAGREFVERIKREYNVPLRGMIKMSGSAIQYVDTRDL